MTQQGDLVELQNLLQKSMLLRLETEIVEGSVLLKEVVVRLPNGQMIAFCQDSEYKADYFMCKWVEDDGNEEGGDWLFVPVKDITSVLKQAANFNEVRNNGTKSDQ
jgi:hypothetical protein